MSLATGFFLDLGSVEQRGDDRCRADTDRDSGFHQLAPALFVGSLGVVAVTHGASSMEFDRGWEAA